MSEERGADNSSINRRILANPPMIERKYLVILSPFDARKAAATQFVCRPPHQKS
jgi:hypothetical protein